MDVFLVSYVCLMLIPSLSILAGLIMWKYSPTHLHSVVGFRTSRAMMDGESWKYANTTAGRLLVRYSLMILIISAVLPFFFLGAPDASFQALTIVLLIAQVVTVAVCLVAAQIMLMRRFPKTSSVSRKSSRRR